MGYINTPHLTNDIPYGGEKIYLDRKLMEMWMFKRRMYFKRMEEETNFDSNYF